MAVFYKFYLVFPWIPRLRSYFFIFMKNISFSFSVFLEFGRLNLKNLDAQRCLQNWHADLKSALDQHLKNTILQNFSVKKWALVLWTCHENFIRNERILKNKN